MGQNSIISSFFARRVIKASAEGRSPPQELEVGPRSGPYLLVITTPCSVNVWIVLTAVLPWEAQQANISQFLTVGKEFFVCIPPVYTNWHFSWYKNTHQTTALALALAQENSFTLCQSQNTPLTYVSLTIAVLRLSWVRLLILSPAPSACACNTALLSPWSRPKKHIGKPKFKWLKVQAKTQQLFPEVLCTTHNTGALPLCAVNTFHILFQFSYHIQKKHHVLCLAKYICGNDHKYPPLPPPPDCWTFVSPGR